MALSELFQEIFNSGSGGCYRECLCGKVHFDENENDGWDWENGELEDLQVKASKDPDHYQGHDHAISTMELAGLEIVYECQCGIAEKYENFILHHAEQLATYLNKKAEEIESKANKMKVK